MLHYLAAVLVTWGLRSYGTPEQVWGGDADCEHEWGSEQRGKRQDLKPASESASVSRMGTDERQGKGPPSGGYFCQSCGVWRGHLGLEPTPELYVSNMVSVFREVWRVLADSGTVFLNIGDAYAGSSQIGGTNPSGLLGYGNSGTRDVTKTHAPKRATPAGLKPKDLVMIPFRLALALQADGWWIRSDIIWAKGLSFCPSYSGSVMPESCTDRPTTSHEHVFLLTKNARYFYDAEAVREKGRIEAGTRAAKGSSGRLQKGVNARPPEYWEYNGTRNLRSVWVINPEPFPGAHFATFPQALVTPMIKAGTSEKGQCRQCRAPLVREVAMTPEYRAVLDSGMAWIDGSGKPDAFTNRQPKSHPQTLPQKNKTIGWSPSCKCIEAAIADGISRPGTEPQTVLDIFMGSGTTLIVALRLGRKVIGIELSPEYVKIAKDAIDGPLFAGVTT